MFLPYALDSLTYEKDIVLPCTSTTWSRFHRQAWTQLDAENAGWLHGSPGLLPKTGTVQVALDEDRPPNQYCAPARSVSTHHSPSLAPLPAPVRRMTRDPSS